MIVVEVRLCTDLCPDAGQKSRFFFHSTCAECRRINSSRKASFTFSDSRSSLLLHFELASESGTQLVRISVSHSTKMTSFAGNDCPQDSKPCNGGIAGSGAFRLLTISPSGGDTYALQRISDEKRRASVSRFEELSSAVKKLEKAERRLWLEVYGDEPFDSGRLFTRIEKRAERRGARDKDLADHRLLRDLRAKQQELEDYITDHTNSSEWEMEKLSSRLDKLELSVTVCSRFLSLRSLPLTRLRSPHLSMAPNSGPSLSVSMSTLARPLDLLMALVATPSQSSIT